MDSFSRDGTTSLVISEDETLDFLEVSMPLKSVSDDEMRCIETLSFIEIHIVRHYPAKVLDISLVRPQMFNLFVRHYMENKTLPPFLVYLTGAINAEKEATPPPGSIVECIKYYSEARLTFLNETSHLVAVVPSSATKRMEAYITGDKHGKISLVISNEEMALALQRCAAWVDFTRHKEHDAVVQPDDKIVHHLTKSYLEVHIDHHYPSEIPRMPARVHLFDLFVGYYLKNHKLPPFLEYLQGEIKGDEGGYPCPGGILACMEHWGAAKTTFENWGNSFFE